MQQIMKKPISLLLILALILSMMPFMVDEVNAATPATKTNMINLVGSASQGNLIDDGYEWNHTTHTLTLENFSQNITEDTVGFDNQNYGFYFRFLTDDITVVVNGNNSITFDNNSGVRIFKFPEAINISFLGQGTLTMDISKGNISSEVINCSNDVITVNGPTLNMDANFRSIFSNTLNIIDGKINANNHSSDNVNAIYSNNVYMYNGELSVESDNYTALSAVTFNATAGAIKFKGGLSAWSATNLTLPVEYKYKKSETDDYTEYSATNGAEPYAIDSNDKYAEITTADVEDNTSPTPPATTPPATTPPTDTTKVPLKGDIIKSDTLNYKVTNPSTDGTGEITVYGFLPGMDKANLVIPKIYNYNGINYKVTAIGKRAFIRNKKLKKVKIGDNVKLIGFCAFYKCKNLKKVTIGSGLTKISNHVFCHDTKLKTIDIKSKKLKSVGKHVILKANNLKIKVPKSKVKKYKKLFKNKGQKKSSKVKVIKK